jgi:hypothetical protein
MCSQNCLCISIDIVILLVIWMRLFNLWFMCGHFKCICNPVGLCKCAHFVHLSLDMKQLENTCSRSYREKLNTFMLAALQFSRQLNQTWCTFSSILDYLCFPKFVHLSSIFSVNNREYTVAYMLKARTVETEKQCNRNCKVWKEQ